MLLIVIGLLGGIALLIAGLLILGARAKYIQISNELVTEMQEANIKQLNSDMP